MRVDRSKFVPPALPSDVIRRDRLLSVLDDLSVGCTILIAAAGYGKTTLLSSWARQRTGTVAWITLDPSDNDPARFGQSINAAFEAASSTLDLGPQQLFLDSAVSRLLEEVALSDQEHTLILDDYHLIKSPEVHGAISRMIERLSANIHLVLSTRVEPSIRLSRLQVSGLARLLTERDIRLDDKESRLLIATSARIAERESYEPLLRLIEGWPAGIRLLGIASAKLSTPFYSDTLAGGRREVAQFLFEEVFSQLNAQLRDFLLRVSIVQRFCADLCSVLVSPKTKVKHSISKIVALHLFITREEATEIWYSLHPLFTDFLRSKLVEETPDLPSKLHAAAARWYAPRNAELAVEHALEANDFHFALDLIEPVLETILGLGQALLVRGWLEKIPAEFCNDRPWLLARGAWAYAATGRYEQVEKWIERAEASLALIHNSGGTPSKESEIKQLLLGLRIRVARMRGEVDVTIALCEAALGEQGGDSPAIVRATILRSLGETLFSKGRLREARSVLENARAEAVRGDVMTVKHSTTFSLVQLDLESGHLKAAYRRCEESIVQDERNKMTGASTHAYALVGMAQVMWERGELDKAQRYLEQGIPLGLSGGGWMASLHGHLTIANIEKSRGRYTRAESALSEAAHVAGAFEFPDLVSLVRGLRARLAIETGDVAAAREWEGHFGPERNPLARKGLSLESELITVASLRLAEGKPKVALGILNTLATMAQETERFGKLIEILLYSADAYRMLSRGIEANYAIERALKLGTDEGYHQIFADRKLVAITKDPQGSRQPIPPADRAQLEKLERELFDAYQSDPLTLRELELLSHLAKGLSNNQVAELLGISLNTTKGHIRNLMAKLGVQSRTHAAARARRWNLLADD